MSLREAAKAFTALMVVLAVVGLWWRWPEDTISGVWSGQANNETLHMSLLQETTGDIHGHGVLVANTPRTVTGSGKVEGTRIGDLVAMTLTLDKQTFTLFVKPTSRGQLAGEFFRAGSQPAAITLSPK